MMMNGRFNMFRTNTASVRSSPAPVNFLPQEKNQPQKIRLTTREKEVLQWTAAGKSSWEIAQIISCTEAGVNYHFCNIQLRRFLLESWIGMRGNGEPDLQIAASQCLWQQIGLTLWHIIEQSPNLGFR
jgi:LuxR family quorum-sensing transcriptional regulator LasR